MSDSPGLQVPASYLLVFVNALSIDRGERDALLASAGLSRSELTAARWLALETVLRVLGEVDQRTGPGWHVEPALSLEAAHHGPLGVAVVTAATPAEGLDTLVAFEAIRAPWAVLQSTTENRWRRLRILPVRELGAAGALLMEINAIALIGLIARLAEFESGALILRLPGGHRNWPENLVAAVPASVVFESRHFEIAIASEALERPGLLADADLHAAALAHCRAHLDRATVGGSLGARIRRLLLDRDGNAPGIERVAGELNQSPRSLARHLAAQGSSYRALVDEVRQIVAEDLLSHSGWPAARIAEQLGYSDPANFTRAFRRWTGQSPDQWRRGNQG